MQITPLGSFPPSWLNSTSSIAKASQNAAIRTYSVQADSESSTSSAIQTLNTQGTLRTRIKTLVEELRYHLKNPEKDVTALTEVLQQVTKLEKSPAEQQVANTTPRVESRTTVTGRNDAQISNVQINSPLEANSTLTLRGQVTRAASAAKIVVTGSEHGLADSNSEFELLGKRGATYVDITAGETWQTVANRINGQKNVTGVSATVKDGKLELVSGDVGGEAAIRLQPRNLVSDGITGLNNRQITSVAVHSQVGGTREEIGGMITTSAQRAEVMYQGTASGKVGGSASFRLSGVRGNVRISVTAGESLADVANRINQHQDATGVVATVAETKLVLASDTTGAAATVRVDDVQSGNASPPQRSTARSSAISRSNPSPPIPNLCCLVRFFARLRRRR